MRLSDMKMSRIVDLSHELYPSDEKSELHVKTYFVEEILPKYKREKDQWYIIQRVAFLSHVGTHIEAPLHYIKDGEDVSEIPLKQIVGEAVILDFTHKKPNEEISLGDIIEAGRDIRPGDMVLIKTGLSKYVDRFAEYERPYVSKDAIKWLVQKKIGCLGIDCSGIEDKRVSRHMQPNHQILFENKIPLIENLTNLDQLRKRRFLLIILPLRIRGLDACPVRAVAIEEQDT
jgi:arylformamidase